MARLTEACRARGWQIEPERAKRKNARYCRSCAYPAKLAQNAARKRAVRRQIGWRPYYHLYAPIPNGIEREAERKKLHRRYMRAYRAWKKRLPEVSPKLTDPKLAHYRNAFIKAQLAAQAALREAPAVHANAAAKTPSSLIKQSVDVVTAQGAAL
jgi:hypothetical protein